MPMSITPTLALVGEPEAETPVRISPDNLAASYTEWVASAEALISAQQTEALSFDNLITTVGRANLDSGVSLRDIAQQIKDTGVPMPVISEDGKVDRIVPSKSTIDRWVAMYVVMRDGDVTSHVARQITEGMGNVGMPTAANVRKEAIGAATDGKDVLSAVRGLFTKAKADSKEPKAFDPAKATSKVCELVTELMAHRDQLTPELIGQLAGAGVSLRSLVG